VVNEPIDHKAETESVTAQRSRELFDQQVANLDAGACSRLNQARQAALDAARGKAGANATAWGPRWLLPVGSVAALALVAVTAVQLMRPDASQPPLELAYSAGNTLAGSAVASNVDDVEILTADADLELLQNMDFYAWVETQPEAASAGSNASEAG
jgi:hypothetical protein